MQYDPLLAVKWDKEKRKLEQEERRRMESQAAVVAASATPIPPDDMSLLRSQSSRLGDPELFFCPSPSKSSSKPPCSMEILNLLVVNKNAHNQTREKEAIQHSFLKHVAPDIPSILTSQVDISRYRSERLIKYPERECKIPVLNKGQ